MKKILSFSLVKYAEIDACKKYLHLIIWKSYILGIKNINGEKKVVKDAAIWMYIYSVKNRHALYMCGYKYLAGAGEGEKEIMFVLLQKPHY